MPIGLVLTMSMTLLLLFGFLFGLLAAAGYYLQLSGYVVVVLAITLVFVQWLIGPKIIWWTTNMRLLEKKEYPWLWETVEEICKKKKVPMPKLAIARIGSPNAFVFGRTPGTATLTVTQGLLNTLTQDEVKAVVGHEIGHIKHRDMVVMTIVGAIPVIAYFLARSLMFTPRDEGRRGGGAVLVGIIAFIIYFVSNLLVLFFSRLREYHADDFGGKATKPSLLAGALAKITYGLGTSHEKGQDAARSFYIADPIGAVSEISQFKEEYKDFDLTNEELKKAMKWEEKNPFARISEIFRTHPLTFKRVMKLKKLEKEIKV